MKSLRRIGSSVAARASTQVGQRAAEVRLLGEHRDGRRAAALVGAHDRRRSSRPRGSTPAEGERRLCSAISEVPGRDSASENGRPSRSVSTSRSSSRERAARSCAGRTASRVASTRSSSRDAHALAQLHVALQDVAARRPSRSASSARRAPSSSESARPPDVDGGAGVHHGHRALRARLARQHRAQDRRVLVGAAGAHGGVVRGLDPEVLGAHVVCVEFVARSARPRGWARPRRTRRGHPRSTLPGPSRCRAPGARGRSSSMSPASETPITWRVAPAGLVSGPRKLNTVRTASSLRTGTTCSSPGGGAART